MTKRTNYNQSTNTQSEPYQMQDQYERVQDHRSYQNTGAQQEPIPAVPNASQAHATQKSIKRSKQRRFSRTFSKLLIMLAMVTIALIVAISTVFRLDEIVIHGRESKSLEEIVMASGLVRGRNVLFVKEEDVRSEIAKDHTLIFLGMQKEYPNKIHLSIEERKSVAVMQWAGMRYMLDDDAMVMSENSSLDDPVSLPLVIGFKVNYVTVGQQLMVNVKRQIDAYQAIMLELYEQMISDMITEINLADEDNIYLMTVYGTSVKLGDESNMIKKMALVKSFSAYMRQFGDSKGYLDVSSGTECRFKSET